MPDQSARDNIRSAKFAIEDALAYIRGYCPDLIATHGGDLLYTAKAKLEAALAATPIAEEAVSR